MIELHAEPITWALREPFVTASGSAHVAKGIIVTLIDPAGHRGRGEAYGVAYTGETPSTMLAEVESVRDAIEETACRTTLCQLLPPGGARCALDVALWELEARRSGCTVAALAGTPPMGPTICAQTIGIRSLPGVSARAGRLAECPLIKIKVDASAPLEVIRTVHEVAPQAHLIVDPNQSWTCSLLSQIVVELARLNVVLLEQPLMAGDDDALSSFHSPVPLCADESVRDRNDIECALGRYDAINIKLDKCGGLTEALAMVYIAKSQNLRVMVGCMFGSSLAMAPAALLAPLCDFVDLDGPLLQYDDFAPPLTYTTGNMSAVDTRVWG